jgi:hypothetical protein
MADSDNLYGVGDHHNPGDDPYHITNPPPVFPPAPVPPPDPEPATTQITPVTVESVYTPEAQMSPSWIPETHPAGPPTVDPSTYPPLGQQPKHWTEL